MADTQDLFAAHHSGLVRYLTHAVGHRETAQDLAQDAFVRAAQAPMLPVGDGAQRAWLFKIARNLAIDHHRRSAIRNAGRVDVDVDPPIDEKAHLGVMVRQALAALDELAREVFVMRELAGLSYGEIADVCDITPDAVRSRIHRARMQLREHLERPLTDARTRLMRNELRRD
jgi:RNA polymerase sigma-70 factor (ECF subfamily)